MNDYLPILIFALLAAALPLATIFVAKAVQSRKPSRVKLQPYESGIESTTEPFFTTKSRGHGTGLGLATTYGAVRQAGGHISVWSQPGQGTTFTLYFPCAMDEPLRVEPRRSAADHKSGGGRHVVLLVEDDEALRRLTKRMLERNGFEVLDASHPNAAVQIFETHRDDIDAVLTDVIMPGGTGKDLVDRLKGISPELRFIFMSGYPEEVVAHHGVLDEGVPFIEKPFTESSLIEGLRAVVDAA